MPIDYDTLFAAALAPAGRSGGSGGSGRAPDTGQIIRAGDGNYYRVMDNGDIIPIDIPGTEAAAGLDVYGNPPPFDNYGGAVYTGVDGPMGAVYRASNGQYVYGDQVFNSIGEVNALLNASDGGGGAETIRQGPDGQYYTVGADGSFSLIPGMPAGIENRSTQIVTIGGMSTLVDTDTGETIRVLGPAGSGSSSGGSSGGGGGSSAPAPRAATNVVGNGGSGYDSAAMQLQNAAAQRDWQSGESALDRAQRAAEFAQSYGLQAAAYELNRKGQKDQAARTYGELVSSADTAALPAYLAAGGGNIWNSLSSGNSMLTDNAIRPGAMALDNVRSYDTPGTGTGGGSVAANPFDPANPVTDPSPPGPQVLNPDGTVSHGGGSGATPGEGYTGYGTKGQRIAPGYTATINGPRRNGTMPFTEGWVNPNAIDPNYEANMAPYYENISRIAAGQGNPASSAANVAPTMYPGSTFWSGSTLMYNTPSGPVPATMIDPYQRADVMRDNPYNTTRHASQQTQEMVANDPRSQNPNLNLNSIERSSFVQPRAAAPGGNGAVNFGQNAAGGNAQTPGYFPIPTMSGPGGAGTGTAASGGWNYTPGTGWSIQAPAASLRPYTPPQSAATNIPRRANGGMINGIGIVGDQPNGQPTGHEELIFAPQGAMVVPMNQIGKHAKGGAINPFQPAPPAPTGFTPPAPTPQFYDPTTGTTSHGGLVPPAPTSLPPMQNAVEPPPVMNPPMQSAVEPPPTLFPPVPAPDESPTPAITAAAAPPATTQMPGSAPDEVAAATGGSATPATSTTKGGYTIINGPDTTPPGTQMPNPGSAEEVRRWRESFPIPEITGPYGALNPFDVAWNNVDPMSRDVFYNARQTRYGIPAQSQAWEQQRYALPGMQRPGWGY